MKIRIYNENGIIRISEVTSRDREITVFGSVVNGEYAEVMIARDAIDYEKTKIVKPKP